jgi:hypothetical protein
MRTAGGRLCPSHPHRPTFWCIQCSGSIAVKSPSNQGADAPTDPLQPMTLPKAGAPPEAVGHELWAEVGDGMKG